MKLTAAFGTVEPARWHAVIEPEQRRYLTEQLWSNPEILLEVQGSTPLIRPDIALVVMLGFDRQPIAERCVFPTGGELVPMHLTSSCTAVTIQGALSLTKRVYEVLSGCAWTRLPPEQLPSNIHLASDGRACVALIRYMRIA